MSAQDAKIKPLPLDVIAKLKSSTSITHLNGVIVELVKNALDANAHSISVAVDFQRGGCVVEDNGEGIPPDEFESDGGLGKAHRMSCVPVIRLLNGLAHHWPDTSKFSSYGEIYSRRGSFLASLASLSLLTITSRHLRHSSTNTIIFHHSTPIARLLPAPIQQRLRFSGYGTCVTVNDLFGNMPVRVKSRALALQRPDELEREWEDLKQLLVAVMLANDQLTKLVLSDESKNRKVAIRPQALSRRTEDGLDVQRVSSILAHAGLANAQSSDCWSTVSASVPDFSIHAALCLVPSPTKRVQFISLGMVPVFPRNATNVLFSEVNRLFASSDFGGNQTSLEDSILLNTRMVPKTVNRWPMFYIRIDTHVFQQWDEDDHEMAPETNKSIQRILDVLTAMINEFLTQRNLRPRAGKRKRKAPQVFQETGQGDPKGSGKSKGSTKGQLGTPGSTEEALDTRLKLPNFQKAIPMANQNFGDWSRVKGSKEPMFHAKLPVRKPAATTLNERDHASVEGQPARQIESGDESKTTDGTLPWTDPYTGRTHLVNSRTGHPVEPMTANNRPRSTGFIQPERVLERVRRPTSAMSTATEGSWVDNLLKKWDNPTFTRAEKPISCIDVGMPHEHELDRAFEAQDSSGNMCGLDTVRFSKFRGKLWKQHLERAEVVAQVDRKFILAKLPASPDYEQTGAVIVLIDQHAADERCRVERLFEEMFASSRGQVQTMPVEPIMFEAPLTEMTLLKRHRRFFRSWGIGYHVEQTSNKICVFVDSLPTLIAERCRTEPSLLTELIRSEVWKREENPLNRSEDHNTATPWVQRLSNCPQGLIDLLNSRACRTAIMFNDVLEASECQQLVAQLARCVFPFQCAHGRPSMVPIVEVQQSFCGDADAGLGLDAGLELDDISRVGFLEAFGNMYSA